LGITWGGLVRGRGHRTGQLRVVLGSPSARHTKEPRTGGPPGGRGVRGPDFFLAKAPSCMSEGTKTGLQTPRANLCIIILAVVGCWGLEHGAWQAWSSGCSFGVRVRACWGATTRCPRWHCHCHGPGSAGWGMVPGGGVGCRGCRAGGYWQLLTGGTAWALGMRICPLSIIAPPLLP
jgi:hypothetical protein